VGINPIKIRINAPSLCVNRAKVRKTKVKNKYLLKLKFLYFIKLMSDQQKRQNARPTLMRIEKNS
jgi:hypothetical protein